MPAEIIGCELVTHPPLRFVGKRFDTYPDWSQAWVNGWFDIIEQTSEIAFINDDSYCVLRGNANGSDVYYLGEFCVEGSKVPAGLDYADLSASSAAIAYIKGKIEEVYALTADNNKPTLLAAFADSGIEFPADAISAASTTTDPEPRWLSFERDNCPRFTDPDAQGNVILDFAVYLS
ncbi:MAG: hypothetical protein FWH50_02395 [Coriobacteriia bacterium]|nr:hypothetical protein [Coriobacteriia bacterium]